MRSRPLIVLTIVAMVLTALVTACSTQKAKWSNVFYHNTTAHYNVWWNGNESLKRGIEKLSQNDGADDYTQILPVYKMGNKTVATSVYPDMDRAIEKGIKGIKQHSIFVGGKEHVEYVKECYLLTAYANFYKYDVVATENTCQMIASQFAGTRIGDEGELLLARCMTMDGRYSDAESRLDELAADLLKGNFSKQLQEELYLAQVECLLPQQKYKKAVDYIKSAVEVSHNRKTKARLYFIMAQIYQKLDKRPTATKYYSKVLDYSPDYVMEFNARINIASCADLEHSDLAKLEKLLNKMLDDRKNVEYRDQVYYAMGEMYLGMKENKKACDSYKKSVAVSTVNKAQKAKSALRLADLLYDTFEDYDASQTYYDTAMAIIAPDYPNYYDIRQRYSTLTSLVQHTRLVERNDSLIAVADLPTAEREALIKKKIADLKQKEKEEKERQLIEQFAADSKAQTNTLQGDWYFYNANTVQKGKETFKQRWGMRALEDYWFLEKKGLLGMGMMIAGLNGDDDTDDEAEEGSENDTVALQPKKGDNPDDPHNRAYYMKELPKSVEERDSMHMLTADALLSAGYIYYEGIKNTPRALDCYLRLANDYTEYPDVVQAFYQLYMIYDKQGNTPSANYYREMVMRGFPDSDYANMLRDSEYYKEILKREQRIMDDYADVYTSYRRRRYIEVLEAVAVAEQQYEGMAMLAKFRYWQGLALARLDRNDEAIATFQSIVGSRPASDTIVPLSQAMITYLRGDNDVADKEASHGVDDQKIQAVDEQFAQGREGSTIAPQEEEQLPAEAQMFRYKEKREHYVVIVVNDKNIKATELQYRISDFNSEFYSNSGYKVSTMMFTDSTQLITIHRYVDANEAMSYWQHLQQDTSPLRKYKAADYTAFPISTQNYNTFYARKNVEAYQLFFKRYYLN